MRPLSSHQTGVNQELLEWGTEAQMEEQHKDACCLINPGSKMKQFWCISGSLMSGEIVAATVTERFLCFRCIKDVKLQGVYRALTAYLLYRDFSLNIRELLRSPHSPSWMDKEREKGKNNLSQT